VISISLLESWQVGTIRDGASALTGAAGNINGLQGEFTGATDLGAAWKGQASDAANASATAMASSFGETAATLQDLSADLNDFATAVETAQNAVKAAKAMVADAGLPLQMGDDGRFPPLVREQAIVLETPEQQAVRHNESLGESKSGLGGGRSFYIPQIAADVAPPKEVPAPGYPQDIVENFDAYADMINQSNQVVPEALTQVSQIDEQVSGAMRSSGAVLATVTRDPMSAASAALARSSAPAGQPWAIVADTPVTLAANFGTASASGQDERNTAITGYLATLGIGALGLALGGGKLSGLAKPFTKAGRSGIATGLGAAGQKFATSAGQFSQASRAAMSGLGGKVSSRLAQRWDQRMANPPQGVIRLRGGSAPNATPSAPARSHSPSTANLAPKADPKSFTGRMEQRFASREPHPIVSRSSSTPTPTNVSTPTPTNVSTASPVKPSAPSATSQVVPDSTPSTPAATSKAVAPESPSTPTGSSRGATPESTPTNSAGNAAAEGGRHRLADSPGSHRELPESGKHHQPEVDNRTEGTRRALPDTGKHHRDPVVSDTPGRHHSPLSDRAAGAIAGGTAVPVAGGAYLGIEGLDGSVDAVPAQPQPSSSPPGVSNPSDIDAFRNDGYQFGDRIDDARKAVDALSNEQSSPGNSSGTAATSSSGSSGSATGGTSTSTSTSTGGGPSVTLTSGQSATPPQSPTTSGATPDLPTATQSSSPPSPSGDNSPTSSSGGSSPGTDTTGGTGSTGSTGTSGGTGTNGTSGTSGTSDTTPTTGSTGGSTGSSGTGGSTGAQPEVPWARGGTEIGGTDTGTSTETGSPGAGSPSSQSPDSETYDPIDIPRDASPQATGDSPPNGPTDPISDGAVDDLTPLLEDPELLRDAINQLLLEDPQQAQALLSELLADNPDLLAEMIEQSPEDLADLLAGPLADEFSQVLIENPDLLDEMISLTNDVPSASPYELIDLSGQQTESSSKPRLIHLRGPEDAN
jgi:hypothetical protein